MPKNTVTDPITGQEITFAHLVLSGTMTDRDAAEAAGLNPDTAAYTKAKPRVRDYMIEHRNAVSEKLVEKEVDLSRRAAEGLRKLNLGRDQVLARLWELAMLSHEVTRGTIAGQIKALSMIIAIEDLIPGRRLSPPQTQPTAQESPHPVAATKAPRDALAPTGAEPNQPSPPHPLIPQGFKWVPFATGFDAALHAATSLTQPLSLQKSCVGPYR